MLREPVAGLAALVSARRAEMPVTSKLAAGGPRTDLPTYDPVTHFASDYPLRSAVNPPTNVINLIVHEPRCNEIFGGHHFHKTQLISSHSSALPKKPALKRPWSTPIKQNPEKKSRSDAQVCGEHGTTRRGAKWGTVRNIWLNLWSELLSLLRNFTDTE